MSVKYNNKGLKTPIDLLKKDSPKARVGVLGEAKNRDDADGPTNVQIGQKHEFGTDELPQRSFLRVPVTEKMQSYLDDAKGFDEDAFKEVVKEKSLVPWIKKIGVIGETIVLDAFDSAGFGKWEPSNMKYKKNHETLVESQQLRNSIASDVKE